jgi:hypothetical protein
MTNGHITLQAIDHGAGREVVADEAVPAFGVEMLAIEADDARGFLATMLKGVEAKRSQSSGVGMIENPENPTLFVQPVFFKPAQDGIANLSLISHGHGPPLLK